MMNMRPFDWLKQPPHASVTTLLVDELSDKLAWGITTDIEKINYNRQFFDEDEQLNIGIESSLALSGGITGVCIIGPYLTVVSISRDEQQGSMLFFDYRAAPPIDRLRPLLKKEGFSEGIVRQFLETQSWLVAGGASFLVDRSVTLLKP